MLFGREFLEAFFGQSSHHEPESIRRRRRKLSAGVQTLEGRTLLSHVGVVHVEHSVSAMVSKLDHKHGHGQHNGAHHNAHDDKGAHNHGKDNSGQLNALDRKGGRGNGKDDGTQHDQPYTATGRNGQDDPAGHDRLDDHGTAANDQDDPAGHGANDDKGGHDANDDKGGHGKDDGTGHKSVFLDLTPVAIPGMRSGAGRGIASVGRIKTHPITGDRGGPGPQAGRDIPSSCPSVIALPGPPRSPVEHEG